MKCIIKLWYVSSFYQLKIGQESFFAALVCRVQVLCADLRTCSRSLAEVALHDECVCLMMKYNYKKEFIKVGCTIAIWNSEERPHEFLCRELHSNESSKMNKLDWHFQTKYSQHRGKSEGFLSAQEETFKRQCFDSTVHTELCIHIYEVLKTFTWHSANVVIAVMCFYNKINSLHFKFSEWQFITLASGQVSKHISSS